MSKKKKQKKQKQKKRPDIVAMTIKSLGLDLVPEQMTDDDYYVMSRITSGQLFGATTVQNPPS